MWTAEMAFERGAWGEAALWNPMVLPITMVRHGIEGKMVDLPASIILNKYRFCNIDLHCWNICVFEI